MPNRTRSAGRVPQFTMLPGALWLPVASTLLLLLSDEGLAANEGSCRGVIHIHRGAPEVHFPGGRDQKFWKTRFLHYLPPSLPPPFICVLASSGIACTEHGADAAEGCVCRKLADCPTARKTTTRGDLPPTACCDHGLVCCPLTGLSQKSRSENFLRGS